MASKVEVFLPEFDDLTLKQTEQIHQFVEQFLSPSSLSDSYKWLRNLDGTEHEFTYANVIDPDEKDFQKHSSEKSGDGKKKKEGNDDGHAQDEPTEAGGEEDSGLIFPMCPRRVLAYKLLVARKWDMAKAFEMLRDSVAWRESNEYHVRLFFPSPIVINGYDNKTLQNYFKFEKERPRNEDLDRYVRRLRPHYWCNFHKWDKAGHPIIIEMIGQIDAKGGLKSLKDVVRPGQHLSYPVAVMHSFQNELANLLIRYQDALQAQRWVEERRRNKCKGDEKKDTVTSGTPSCGGQAEEGDTPPPANTDASRNIDDDNIYSKKRTEPFASPVASPNPVSPQTQAFHHLCLHSRKNLLPSNGPIRRVTSITAILDASGLGMSLLCSEAIEIVKTTLALDQANYPELLHRCFIVNCPTIIMFAYNIFKGSIDPRVRAKITFCGVDETHDILRKVVDAENLPTFLGGTCECPGGCVCKTAEMCAGGSTHTTPSNGDRASNNKSTCDNDQLDKDPSFVPTLEAKIGSREEKTEIIAVREGETVCWEWESSGKRTIEFSALFYPRDPSSYTMKMKEHIETLRVDRNKNERINVAAPASSSAPTGKQELENDQKIKNSEKLAVLKDPLCSKKSSASSVSQPNTLSSSSPVSSSPSGGPQTDDLSISPFVEVMPAERIVAHEGEFTSMGGDGKLVVSWSNAFSMFTGKSLRYRLYKKQQ